MGNFKVNTPQSSMLEGLKDASGPPPLADQAEVPMGPLETDFRGQKQARRDAMQATNTVAKIDSEAKQTTGTPKRLTTIRVDEKRQV